MDLIHSDGRWHWDKNALNEASTAATHLFLLCHPHNPVGRCWSREELLDLAAFAEAHDLIVCSDEIHCGLILDADKRHIPFASLSADAAKRSITLMAPSKTFNIPGLGCAFAVIPDAALRLRFLRAMDGIVPHVNVLGLAACEAAYRDCTDWHRELIAYLAGNRDLVETAVNTIPGIKMSHVEATYLALIDVRSLGLAQPAAHFEAHGLGLSDGADFGAPGWLRLNFGCPRSRLGRSPASFQAGLQPSMNSYTLAVLALLLAAVAQTSAAWIATELFLLKGQSGTRRRAWLAISLGAMLLALQHGYAIELALRTGLFDLRQALLAMLVALFFALGLFSIRRSTA